MKIAIIGHGGHAKVVAEIVQMSQNDQIVAFLDDKYADLIEHDGHYLGPISAFYRLLSLFPDIRFLIAIGDNQIRQKIVQRLSLADEQYATLIHKNAIISRTVTIGHGTVVMANAVIQADAVIGNHSIINTSAVIEHDNIIGDHVHICPNVTLAGTVQVADGAFIGTGANVIPNQAIGKWAVIGAGSTVIDEIPAYCTAVGVPAKVKHENVRGGV